MPTNTTRFKVSGRISTDDYPRLLKFIEQADGCKYLKAEAFNGPAAKSALQYLDEKYLIGLRQAIVPRQAESTEDQWLHYWADILRFQNLDEMYQPPTLRNDWFGNGGIPLPTLAEGKLPLNPQRDKNAKWQDLVEFTQRAAQQPNGPPSGKAEVLLLIGHEYQSKRQDKIIGSVVLALPAYIDLETGELDAHTASTLLINTNNLSSEDRTPRNPVIGPLMALKEKHPGDGWASGSAPLADAPGCPVNEEGQGQGEGSERWRRHWAKAESDFKGYQYDGKTEPKGIAEYSWRLDWSDAENRFTFVGLCPYSETPPANRKLLGLIDTLLIQKHRPALFLRALQGLQGPCRQSVDWNRENPVKARLSHLGHMGGLYGLDQAQRLALWQTTVDGAGAITAVSGPPGTGKTSLLQGFVATQAVRSALEQQPCVIVAASFTNQATTNMISAFAQAARFPSNEGEAGFEHRWIDGIPSYGWYYPSSSKLNEASTLAHQTISRRNAMVPDVHAGGIATLADICQPGQGALALLRGAFNRRFMQTLANKRWRARDNLSPRQWLHFYLRTLVGPDEKSTLHRLAAKNDRMVADFALVDEATIDALESRIKELDGRPAPPSRLPEADSLREKLRERWDRHQQLSGLLEDAREFVPDSGVLGWWLQLFKTLFNFASKKTAVRGIYSILLERHPQLPVKLDLATLCERAQEELHCLSAEIAPLQERLAGEEASETRRKRELEDRQRERESLLEQLKPKQTWLDWLKEVGVTLTNCRGPKFADSFADGHDSNQCPDLNADPCENEELKAIFGLGSKIKRHIALAVKHRPRTWEKDFGHDLECLLDVTVRYQAFHVAMRYWESCWLDEAAQELPQDRAKATRLVAQRAAMLAPVIVSTTQTLPGLALFLNAGMEPQHLVEMAEWLIVDEAGQVPPQLALPVFALAKRALVVGDVEQLAPIASVDTRTNSDIRRKNGLAGQQDEHARNHMDAVNGNVMAAAQYSSARHEDADNKRYGVMLKYHYRCRKSIIEYSNVLVYNAIEPLIPMIPDGVTEGDEGPPQEKRWPFHPMGFVAVKGKPERDKGSQRNVAEALEIVNWLKTHRKKLAACFGSVEESVAVITPYRGQKDRLIGMLEKEGFKVRLAEEDRGQANPPPTLIVGTVHALQGAERPIILFSPVTDGSTATAFIDKAMMNVAVSRAKASFMVFGHPQALFAEGRSATPLALLGAYMKEHGRRLYPRDLVILESAVKTELVDQAFGLSAKGIACAGHVRELELEDGGHLRWKTKENGQLLIDEIAEFTVLGERHYDNLYLATDDDREGEAIAWHIMDLCRQEKFRIPPGRFRRLRFYAMHPDALQEGRRFSTAGVDPNRVKAAITRQVADLMIAREISAKATVTGVGRVAAALLDRLEKLGLEQGQTHYVDVLNARCQGERIRFFLLTSSHPFSPPMRFTCLEPKNVIDKPITLPVDHISPLTWAERPAPPTYTAEVLQQMIPRLNKEPKHIMNALQELYEGVARDPRQEEASDEVM